MQARKDNNTKKIPVAPKEPAAKAPPKETGFFDNIFGGEKTDEAPKTTATTKVNDQKKLQQKDIDLSKLFITPKEIKELIDKALAEEKNSTLTTIKSFFGSKKESDQDTPLGSLKKFGKDISRSKSDRLTLANVWELMQLAMNPEIVPNSSDHKLYQSAIGFKLDMLANQTDLLIKLRWYNNYCFITSAKFPLSCRLAVAFNSEADVVELMSVKPRKSPLVIGVKDTVKELASDISSAVDEAVNGASKAVKESTNVTNFI